MRLTRLAFVVRKFAHWLACDGFTSSFRVHRLEDTVVIFATALVIRDTSRGWKSSATRVLKRCRALMPYYFLPPYGLTVATSIVRIDLCKILGQWVLLSWIIVVHDGPSCAWLRCPIGCDHFERPSIQLVLASSFIRLNRGHCHELWMMLRVIIHRGYQVATLVWSR